MGRLHRVVRHRQSDSANSDHGSWCEAIVVIVVDTLAVEEWIRGHAEPVGAIRTVHEQPWATVLRVPLADGVAWFKACAPVQAFEPRLTAELFARWPDRVAEVLGYGEERAWLLPGDPWFTRLRDAYLEPWGRDLGDAFALAVRVGTFARAIAYIRQRAALRPEERPLFDTDFSTVLGRAVAQTLGGASS
jgi:hypothetical protein